MQYKELPKQLELLMQALINSSASIHQVSDTGSTRLTAADYCDVCAIQQMCAPPTVLLQRLLVQQCMSI
jgi:hypothetical protein